MSVPPPRNDGWVARSLLEEFPCLGVVTSTVEVERLGRSPRGVRERLALLANRFHGADALVLRQRPVPHAYRVFFRHIGLDPDLTRVPVEAVAVERLMKGGFPSRGLLEDALTIAVMETGVPLWALDADLLSSPRLGLRLTGGEESLGEGESATPLPPGRIVVVDERVPVALLFGPPSPRYAAGKRTRRVLLFAVRVDGVPDIHVEEALWACAEALQS